MSRHTEWYGYAEYNCAREIVSSFCCGCCLKVHYSCLYIKTLSVFEQTFSVSIRDVKHKFQGLEPACWEFLSSLWATGARKETGCCLGRLSKTSMLVASAWWNFICSNQVEFLCFSGSLLGKLGAITVAFMLAWGSKWDHMPLP